MAKQRAIERTQAIAQAFSELMRRRMLKFPAEAAELGLSPIQARTLCLMNTEQPSIMREVAELTGLPPSNLTGIVDKLEARGLVQRRADANDRRIKMVFMTRKGAALRKQILDRFGEPQPWMLALSEVEQEHLLTLLQKGLVLSATAKAASED